MNAWDVQGGIQRKIGGLGTFGDTAFWGGFSQVNDGFAQGSNGGNPSNPCIPGDSTSDCSPGGNLGGVPDNGILKPAATAGLKLTLRVEVAPTEGVSPQNVDETKVALRELGLKDTIEGE